MNTQMVMQGATCPRCNVTNEYGKAFCANCGLYMADTTFMVERVTFTRRFFGSSLLEGVLLLVTLFIGWLIWLAFTAKNAQTPAKKMTNLYVVKLETGRAVGAADMWLRELVVKRLAFRLAGGISFGLLNLVDALFVFFDKNRQALHDKVLGQVVVYAPRGLPASMLLESGMYIAQPAYAQPMQPPGTVPSPIVQSPPSAIGGGSAPSAPGMSIAEQLRELARLHEAQLLTDEEYERKRSELASQL